MKIYKITYNELRNWIKENAERGDLAYCEGKEADLKYFFTYHYLKEEENPTWHVWTEEEKLQKYIEKLEKNYMEMKCENCEYFNRVGDSKIFDSWCTHEKYSGVRVAAHTLCKEWKEKRKLTSPFDGVRFYLVNACTGEIGIRYICEDCGEEMKKPYHWWLNVPYGNAIPTDLGFHYRCEACEKKKKEANNA